ncbi:MAG: tyrosine-type recombinase/integrase [Cyanobacteria bacterium SZAS TMP-1]|nr:tyrosine-type recombinase/integrase [Cyanobacteria bacterium SZAS TMP-1]
MDKKIKFTIENLGKIECPADQKWVLIKDPKVQGLKLRVMKGGSKSFIYQRRLPSNNENAGKLVEINLGRFGDLAIEQARRKADDLNSLVGQGKDPTGEQQSDLTYGELFNTYIEQYAKHQTNTWEEAVAIHRRHFERWSNKRISKIRRSDVQAWVYDLAGEGRKKKGTANRAYDQMKAVINYGKRKDLVDCDNPCVGVDKFPTQSRERFIQPGDEFAKFAKALAEEPNETWRDFFWISLFVAARRSNVLAMAWHEISFELETWTIPKTKNGDSLTVPLTPSAMEILKRRRDVKDRHDTWVFPSDRRSRKTGEFTHLGNPKEAWKRLLKRAEINDLRIHDLRRTAGSYMAIQGVSPTIIGKALGHRSQAATAMYARLTQDPVRQAMINAQAGLANPEKILKKSGDVVDLKRTNE